MNDATTVWKFTLSPYSDVRLPVDAELLFVAEQHGQLCLWARIDPSRPTVERHIVIVGTGHPAPPKNRGKYIGSALMAKGTFVFHVFDNGEA